MTPPTEFGSTLDFDSDAHDEAAKARLRWEEIAAEVRPTLRDSQDRHWFDIDSWEDS
jgi:hypothetical protein